MQNLNTGFDTEVDSFLDFDQNAYTPVSSTSDMSKGKSVDRPSLSSSNSSSFMAGSSQQFSGPSFQYDNYRQQTGLPVGGLANTFALNQATGMQYNGNHHGFVMPTETLNVPLSNLDDFDFGRHPSGDMSEMDFDLDSPSDAMPTMFYPSTTANGRFVNPTALVSQEDSPTYTAPIQRMYPGIHTQQATQAKAQQAQKQQDMLRQQQQRQTQGQKPLPSQSTQSKPQQPKDPHVEESISRLLSQMRQNSVASTDEDASTPTGNMPNIARLKKEEDDMDEDERLLASEEGKKLSSKERRQLRNKVSARAFRSRRKEYIGQLEGEVAVKVQEANDLRVQNRQLLEENTRLSDLTRMLLSSQAFSGFLNELSQNGMPAPAALATPPKAQPQPTRKDINPNHGVLQAQNQQTQVGMTMIPESAVDFSMLESSTWNAGGMNSYQVCAVTDIPEGPIIDVALLSGKVTQPSLFSSSTPKDCPVLSTPPTFKTKTVVPAAVVNEDVELDEVAFTLFVDEPQQANPTAQELVCPVSPAHVAIAPKFVLTGPTSSKGSWSRLESMCATLDAVCDRLSDMTSHMS